MFSREMLWGLQKVAPELDARAIISMGIPQLRTGVPESFLDTVIGVYCQAINRVLLIPAVALTVATAIVMCMGSWRLGPALVEMPYRA